MKPRKRRPSLLVAVLPVYNEEKTLSEILERVSKVADRVILVNDGSRDSTGRILDRFVRARRGAYRVTLPLNRGMAAALAAGFRFALHLRDLGEIQDQDVVATLDADGQHRPEYLPEGKKRLLTGKLDVLLTSRDFSAYPLYKVLGNWFLTRTNRVLSGFPYDDVESGMRFLRVSALEPILRYYTGFKYSCAQEIALLSARQGLRVANDFQVEIDYYRPGTTVMDGFVVLAYSLAAFFRWKLGQPITPPMDQPLMEESYRESRRLWPRRP